MKVKTLVVAFTTFVLVLVVALGTFVLFGPIRYDIRSFLPLLTVPEEVQEMIFVFEGNDGSSVGQVAYGGLVLEKYRGLRIVQLLRAGDITVALVEQQGNGARDIVRLEGSALEPLTTDGTWKGGIGLSPDGKVVAYSARIDGGLFDEVTQTAYNVGDFETRLLSTDGTFLKTVSGNHPHFVATSTLVTFSERGIEMLDIVRGDAAYAAVHDTFHSPSVPFFGSNRVFLSLIPETKEWAAFEYSPDSPLFYSYFGPLPTVREGFVLTRDEVVYHGGSEGGQFVLKEITSLTEEPITLFVIDAALFNPSAALF